MKKLLQIPLLITALFLSSIPISAYDFEVDGIYYNILNGTDVAVTYKGDSYNDYRERYTGSVIIPNTVTYLETTYSVVSIDSYAFYGCYGMASVMIPNSVRYIYDSFYGCTNLLEINVESGNPWYFSYEGVLYEKPAKLVAYPSAKVEYIVPDFITELKLPAAKSIVIPEGSPIKELTLSGSSILESLVIYEPADTVTLKSLDFSVAVNLKKLILPRKSKLYSSSIKLYLYKKKEESKWVGGYDYTYTFHPIEVLQIPTLDIIPSPKAQSTSNSYNSYNYVNSCNFGSYWIGNKNCGISLPASLKSLTITNQSDFYNSKLDMWYYFSNTAAISDMEITIESPVTNFETETFQNSAITEFEIGLVGTIPSDMLKGSYKLKTLTLPFVRVGTAQTGNLGELFGTVANSNMRAVTQLMEDGSTKTYYMPTGLKELVLSEGCEQLPYGALYNCSMLEKLTLPTTIKGVKENALYGCDGLTDIYVKRALPPSAYETSFTGVNQFGCTLHVPHNSKQYYSIANGWKYFYFIEEEAPLTVSVAKSIENAGEILGINQYNPGETATIEAIAHSGYTFIGWYEGGNLVTTDAAYSFTVTDSRTFVAQFVSVLNENEVTVTPESETVTLSWNPESGASSYRIEVFEDAAMTVPAGTMEVDQNGLPKALSETSVSTTISGLTNSRNYYYRITSYTEENAVLSQYTGSFRTTAGVETVNISGGISSYSVLPGMLVVNGDDDTVVMVADLNGRVMYSGYAGTQLELPLKAGIYILRLGGKAHKVAIR